MTDDLESRIAKLERENRILKKKLARSEDNRAVIEESKDRFDTLYQSVIAELDEQKKQFSALLESAPDAIIITDSDGVIQVVNQRSENLFGHTRGEMIDQKIEMLIPDRFRKKHITHRETFTEQSKIRPMGTGLELTGLIRDGREFPAAISLSPIKTDQGSFVYCTVRDITEQKIADEKLKQQVEELERFSRLAFGREKKMINLKEEINKLLDEMGKPQKYKIVE